MNTPEKITESEWIRASRGVDSVNFQRSAMMTWCSVLMGMAVVVLAEKIVAILGGLPTQGRWYLLLYVITSGLIIAQTWIQIVWVLLITDDPLQLKRTVLPLLNGIAIYIICMSVEDPASWARAVTFFLIVSAVQALNNLRFHVSIDPSARAEHVMIAAFVVYIGITLAASWDLTPAPAAPVAWMWGVIFLGMMGLYVWMQSRSMAREKRHRNIP